MCNTHIFNWIWLSMFFNLIEYSLDPNDCFYPTLPRLGWCALYVSYCFSSLADEIDSGQEKEIHSFPISLCEKGRSWRRKSIAAPVRTIPHFPGAGKCFAWHVANNYRRLHRRSARNFWRGQLLFWLRPVARGSWRCLFCDMSCTNP